MNKYFSGGQFKWLSTDEINKFNLNSISENSSDGYILGVDLQYPDELHDLHNDYTLAPEKLETGYNMLPSFCNGISNEYDVKDGGFNKLFPNLGNKNKCVLHYRNLQLIYRQG